MINRINTIQQLGDRVDLEVRQGSTLGPVRCILTDDSLTPVPIDLTGYTITGMVRRNYGDPLPAAVMEVTFIGALTDGIFEFTIPALITVAMPSEHPFASYLWDMEMTHTSGLVIPLYYGQLRLYPEVTHPERPPEAPALFVCCTVP